MAGHLCRSNHAFGVDLARDESGGALGHMNQVLPRRMLLFTHIGTGFPSVATSMGRAALVARFEHLSSSLSWASRRW